MTDFEAYKLYVVMKNHFSKIKFDFFKYHGKSTASYNSFEKRPDKVFFLKLAKHNDIQGFLVANFLANKKSFSKELCYNEESEKIYKQWMKTKQSLEYSFKQDIKKINPPFQDIFLVHDNSHPTILKLYLQKEIKLETICILIDITGSIRYLDKHLSTDIVWEEIGMTIKKYIPFIKYDKEKYTKIVLDYFNDV
jgi:hypothetical protein